MPTTFNPSSVKFKSKEAPIPEFSWKTSPRLAKIVGADHFEFDIRCLEPGHFSFPYHFHRNAEELFVIQFGKAMLRSPDGFKEVNQNDVIFFEKGPSGAHQLYNHGDTTCIYVDLRTTVGIDVCEYPDSNKINILPYLEVYDAKTTVNYYQGEENVSEKWPEEMVNPK